MTVLSCYSQNYRISGVVLNNKTFWNPLENEKLTDKFDTIRKLNIYLCKKSCKKQHRLLLQSNSSSYSAEIPFKKLKKYKYLEFDVGNKSVFIRIDTTQSFYRVNIDDLRGKVAAKPAIYLYPETKQEITVLHDYKGLITTTYPDYGNGWKVIASPDGKLYNPADNRNYPYLFWEGAYGFNESQDQYTEGFFIEKKDYIDFLQTKLAAIGLNETEITDFVMFWLPVLNQNPYAFVHFRINDNIDNTSFLNIQPKPESVLRVFMEYIGMQSLQGIKQLPEQTFTPFTRKGFTVTEWGGAEIRQYDLVNK